MSTLMTNNLITSDTQPQAGNVLLNDQLDSTRLMVTEEVEKEVPHQQSPYEKAQQKAHLVSEDIYQMSKLKKFTYFAPFLTKDNDPGRILCETTNTVDNFVMFFPSLDKMSRVVANRPYTHCKVEAKINDYASNALGIFSVLVNCAKCSYINLTPFHMMDMYKKSLLKIISKDLQQDVEPEILNTQSMEQYDAHLQMNKAQNFSVKWLMSARPEDHVDASKSLDENLIESNTLAL